MSTVNLPVPVLRVHENIARANTRDVAAYFDKRHDNVLRVADEEARAHASDLRGGEEPWFHEGHSADPTIPGRMDRSYDLTKDGFMMLVMGFTGEKARSLKRAYIRRFNEMEAMLRTPQLPAAPGIGEGAVVVPFMMDGWLVRVLVTCLGRFIVASDLIQLAYAPPRSTMKRSATPS